MNLRPALAFLALAFTLVGAMAPARAQGPTRPSGILIDFRAEAEKSVANDLGRATVYAEATAADVAEVSRRVNAVIAAGISSAKSQPGVSVRSGSSHTYPVYGKGSRNIEGWRMRSEILLESRDAAALSTLLGRLQAQLAVSHFGFTPAPETRRAAEDAAALEAIATFQERAARYAAALKKPYRIRSMSIGGSGQVPPQPIYRAAAMMAEAAPMPVEAGESRVAVTVTGQIELVD
jgi:predicted secreted protein